MFIYQKAIKYYSIKDSIKKHLYVYYYSPQNFFKPI